MSDNQAPVVIVGSGLAGYGVAREWRRASPDTPLVIVTQDGGDSYSKPMLSNALASGKTAATLVMKPAQTMARDLAATVLTRRAVKALDAATQTLTLDDGQALRYRDLVLALGADPIRVPMQGDAADAVLSVNNLDDFAALAQAVDAAQPGPTRQVVIVGAGLIGCEFANDLLSRGFTPVIVDPADRALSRLLPEPASAALQAALSAAGVQWRLGATVQRVDRDDLGGFRVTLSQGEVMPAALVLSAVGLRPRTALASASGLHVARGIVTDRRLQTSAPHVWAVGDCAEVDGLNLPYVMPLMHQSRALASTLNGTPTALAYPAMPVVVKTPAWPTVVCPPPASVPATWRVAVQTDDELETHALNDAGALVGFSLHGKAVGRRAALAGQLVSGPWG